MAVFPVKRLDGRAVLDKSNDDVSVFGTAVLFHDNDIAVKDPRLRHAVAGDAEREKLVRRI